MAVAHFTFAILMLAFSVLHSAMDGSDIDKNMAATLANVDTPHAQAMRRNLIRTGELKSSLNNHLASRLPASKWVGPLNQTLDIGLALLLFAAGAYLMQRQPMGRTLSLIFAGICLLQKLATMAFELLLAAPISRQYLEQIGRMHPKDADLIQGMLSQFTSGPIYQLILAIYPLVVLAVMLQPGILDLLKPQIPEPVLPPEIPPSQRLMSSTPVSTVGSSHDALDELMQRKTF